MKKIEYRKCAMCGRELPVSDFHRQSKDNCKNCVAQKKMENKSLQKKTYKKSYRTSYKLTELDKIAIECAERGISYGQWQQEERSKKNGRA